MDWRKQIVSDSAYIAEYLNLNEEEIKEIEQISKKHPFQTTRYYLSLIDKEDKDDPIRKMQIPTNLEEVDEGEWDTSGEKQNTKLEGLQHKYERTALLLSTNACAMYCRHCFRKRLVGINNNEILNNFDAAADYIEAHDEINNILISGGDSLMLSTETLKHFLERLVSIEHLDFIRLGTRIPVVLPQRISEDKALLDLLEHYGKMKKIYVITQFNHPKELTEEAVEAIAQLSSRGISVNNQTVLLKGVNSEPNVLAELMNKLVKAGVHPYYVFQCRPVKGVKNIFQMNFKEGIDIVREAKKELSGPAKRFKFALSHKTGKIEILGRKDNIGLFKYHQSPDRNRIGEVFMKELTSDLAWFEDDFYDQL